MRKLIIKIQKILPVALVLMLVSLSALAQNLITGTVTDSKDGTPVPGVTVTIKGTRISTQTATDGSFKISAPSANTTLVISSVGFGSKETVVTGGSAGTISLSQSNQQLNEVVVVGYGTARRKDLTGAVTVVTSKDFQKGQISTPEQLIAGKVAGVSITSNGGAPGGGSTIRIRGGASLNASNDPLIVIDGVPLGPARNSDGTSALAGSPDPLSLINPNDIESFNILKDASAAAIYGSRASNGVIIITTKKGSAGRAKINFNTQVSVGTIIKKVDVLTADEFRTYVNKEGVPAQKALLGQENTDWQDEIYQTAISNDNNLSVSGTSKKIPYRVSLGYLNQQGMLRRGELKRASVGLNLSPRLLNNNLKVDLNIKASQTWNQFATTDAIGSAVIYDPTQPVRVNSPRFNGYYEALDSSSKTGLRALAPRNPVALLEQDNNRSIVKRSIGNIVLEYKLPFFPSIRANLNLGYDIAKGSGSNYINDSAASRYQRLPLAAGLLTYGGLSSNYLQEKANTLMEFYLGYNKDIASIRSKIDLIAGYSYSNFRTKDYFFTDRTANGRIVSSPKYPFNIPENTLISVYSRLNYSLMNRYLITATVRRDGSSRFAEENWWGTFPSVAVAWRIKDEAFLRNSKTFTDLKVRLGYGVTGQQEGIGLYDYTSFIDYSNNMAQYQLGNTFYYMARPSAFYPQRKWEETATYNVGLDFGLIDNRITGSAEVYLKKTTDLLNLIDQPAGTNFGNKVIANVGTMENRGVEVTLNADVIRKRDFVWSISVNGTYNKNEITKLTISDDPKYKGNEYGDLGLGTGTTLFIHTVGESRGAFYVYKQVYDAEGKPIDGLFEDINRDGLVNTDDKYRYKNSDPEAFFGFSTNVSCKKLSAGFVMRASLGNYIYNKVNSSLGIKGTVFGSNYLNNAYSDLLYTNFSGAKNGDELSDYFVQNASFLKMDNFNVGYDLGTVFKGRSNLRVNANVQNVFVITKYKGLDPEIAGGIDGTFYPRPRTYVLGFNLDF